jgi:hypothetical protein
LPFSLSFDPRFANIPSSSVTSGTIPWFFHLSHEWMRMHDDKENSNTCVDTAKTWHSFCMQHEGSIRYSYLGCLDIHARLLATWCFACLQVESEVAWDCRWYTLVRESTVKSYWPAYYGHIMTMSFLLFNRKTAL